MTKEKNNKNSILVKTQLRLLAAALGIEIGIQDMDGWKNQHGWQTQLAAKLSGVSGVNTISGWIRRGKIPPKEILSIDELGIAREKWLRKEITGNMILRAILHGDPDLSPEIRLGDVETYKKTKIDPKITGLLRKAKHILEADHPEIGQKPVSMLSMEDWHRIEKRMVSRGIKNRTINTYFVYISGIITWAIDELRITGDHPWRKRKRLKLKNKFRLELFTLEEFKKIKKNARPHLAWAMEVAYHTGVRPGPSELFALKWDDIDWEMKRIRIHFQKTDTWRWQYPDPAFLKRVRAQKQAVVKEYPACQYIVSYHGKQIKSVKLAWSQAKKKAGITRRIRLYDIRHYHITHALAAGADITELAERVGHQNPRMIVEVYAHLAKDLQTNKPFTLPNLYK